jgi:hypothetical protein
MFFRFVTRIILLVSFITPAAYAQDGFDGNFWRDNLDEMARSAFVVGYLKGVETAGAMMPSAVCETLSLPIARCNENGWQAYKKNFGSYGGVRVSQLVAGMNEFYSDYRNRLIAPQGAFHYVAQSIAGTSAQDLEVLVEYQRRNAKK